MCLGFSARSGDGGAETQRRPRAPAEAPSAPHPCLSSSAAVRGGRLRRPSAPAQCRTLRPLLQHVGGGGAPPRGRELRGSGVLRGQHLRDRGRRAGRRQHQQGGRGQGAGRLPCAGRRAGTFTSSCAFRSAALRSDPKFQQGSDVREMTPRPHSGSGPEYLSWCHMGFTDLKNEVRAGVGSSKMFFLRSKQTHTLWKI